jgi:hypothetical protein
VAAVAAVVAADAGAALVAGTVWWLVRSRRGSGAYGSDGAYGSNSAYGDGDDGADAMRDGSL